VNHVPVLVVGGGPVGLAAGLALGRFGVRSLVLERSPTTTDHPKSRGCWVRTMEIFRQWGVEPQIRARGLADGTDVFVYMDRLTGTEYGRTRPEPRGDQSPTWKSIVAQDAVEEELLARIRALDAATVRFCCEVTGFEDLGHGVRATVRDLATGEQEMWRADWLIAADGAGSGVRRAAGIELDGPPVLAVLLNEYVRADLSALPVAQEAAGIFLVPRDAAAPALTLLNTNGADRWLAIMRVGAERDERPRAFGDDEVQDLVRRYAGIASLPVKRINTSTWRMSRQVARQFRKGRVLLAGDAAHRFPPTGGFGLNSGVQDVHNLAWKLALVQGGRASERLLDSYDAERRPVAVSNADWSFGNSRRMTIVEQAVRSGDPDRIAFWIDDLDNHLHSVGQSLGFRYDEGAVVPDHSTPPPASSRWYTPVDRPGSRFPHLWLDPEGTQSTLDWFDRDFALVVGKGAADWAKAGAAVAQKRGIPLALRELPDAGERAGCKLGRRGAALVRPDGHVAWRVAWGSPDPEAEIAKVFDELLG
jgi:2-polyprenyl-6-methoxyphenol hydroxylase-like FAD-dependent oxidoreductase